MRRAWRRIAIAAAVLAAAGAVGVALAVRLGPDQLRMHLEARLAADLDRTVRIGALRIRLDAAEGLHLDLERLRVGGPGDGLRARVPRARVRIDPLALLAGRVRIGRLELAHPELRLREPQAATPGPGAGAGGGAGAPGPWARVREALAAPLPFRWLRIEAGRVTVAPRAPDAPPLVLEAVDAELDARRLRRGRAGRLEGRLVRDEARIPVQLTLETRGEELVATGQVRGLPLASLGRAREALGLARARGRVDLRLEWTQRGARGRGVLLASGDDLVIEPRAAGRPRLVLTSPRLRAELARGPDAWELAFAELSDGSLRLRARGRLGLPAGAAAPLALHLETGELGLRGPGSLLARTPRAWRAPLEAALTPVEHARLAQAGVDLDTTPARLGPLLRGATPRPGELRLTLEVADATLRAGVDDRLEQVSGHLAWDGDRLQARAVRARYRGDPLPRLDLRVRGLSYLREPDELRCVEPGPAPPLHGLPRLVEWLDAQPRDVDGASAFEGVSLRADWLAHPALLCSIEQLAARVVPAPGGLDLEVERAVFAGVPVTGRGAWRGRPREAAPEEAEASLRLDLALGPPFEPMAPRAPRSPWARGRFRAGLRALGPWRLSGADGAFRLSGASLELRHVTVGLVPAGPVRARVALGLGRADALPFEAAFALEEHDAAEVARAGGVARPALSGRLHGAGAVQGDLVPGRSPLDDATGTLVLHARDGRVHRRLPPLLAIAMASGSLNPFASGSELPFEAVDLAARLRDGRLHSEHFALVGPTVRLAAQGSVGASEPHDVDAMVGLFLFPGLDALLDRVPLVGRVLLGPNDNLVGAYLAMDGPFEAPRARLVPIRSIATGPASLVFERIPGLLFGGLRALGGAIRPVAPEEGEGSAAPSRADS